jgi:putative inorganic carbon (HCO3(-)) transporter
MDHLTMALSPSSLPATRTAAAQRTALGFVLRWGWLILLLLAPVVVTITPARTPLLLAVPALVGLQARASPAAHRSPLSLPLLVLAIMVLVSLWATFSLEHSLTKVAGMVLGLGLYAAALAAGRDSARMTALLFAVYLALGGAVVVLGLAVASVGLAGVGPPAGLARLGAAVVALPGAMPGALNNEVAGVLLWVAPVAVALAVGLGLHLPAATRQYGRARALVVMLGLTGLAVGSLSVLILLRSRSAWLGLGLSLLPLPWLLGRRGRLISLAVGAVVVLAGIVVLGSPAGREVLAAWAGQAPATTRQFVKASDPLQTLELRMEIWSRALYGIQDFAFSGMGMNSFRYVVHPLYPLILIAPDADIAHAHNTWLQAALDLGVPGLVALAAIWMTAIGYLVATVGGTRRFEWRAAAIGLLASFAGQFGYGLTDTVALGARPGFLWWLLLALATLVWMHGVPDAGAAPPQVEAG